MIIFSLIDMLLAHTTLRDLYVYMSYILATRTIL